MKRKTVGKYITKKECKGYVKGEKRQRLNIMNKDIVTHTNTHKWITGQRIKTYCGRRRGIKQ